MLPRKKQVLAFLAGLCICCVVFAGGNEHYKTLPSEAFPRILVFAKTLGYHHASIADGLLAIQKLGRENNFLVDTTTNATYFTQDSLSHYAAVVFLSTTGDVLNADQQTAFEGFIQAGGGFAGVHSAADTEYGWPWYNKLLGAYFLSHPAQQTAVVVVKDKNHPSTSMLPDRWQRFDEWYNFKSIIADIHVLATLDETTYQGGVNGENHPIAWYHAVGCGRSWYTGMGHTRASYTEPLFLQHLLGGIKYAIGDGLSGSGCPFVTSLTLVNATTDADIQTINNGAVIDLVNIAGKAINIRANTTPAKVGSVIFALTGKEVKNQTENILPYALYGDNSGNYNTWTPTVGNYILTATAFTGANGTGTSGTSLSRSFAVVDNTPRLSGLTLVNSATDQEIGALVNGQVIDLAVTPGINIKANPGGGKVASVRFGLNTTVNYKTENLAPFAIAGDDQKGDYYNWNVSPGQYTIKATPYSQINAGGTAGTPISVNITIKQSAARSSSTVSVTGREDKMHDSSYLSAYPNPASSNATIGYRIPSGTSSARLTLTNAKGQMIREMHVTSRGEGHLMLNTASLSSGVYTCTLWINGRQADSKLLVIAK